MARKDCESCGSENQASLDEDLRKKPEWFYRAGKVRGRQRRKAIAAQEKPDVQTGVKEKRNPETVKMRVTYIQLSNSLRRVTAAAAECGVVIEEMETVGALSRGHTLTCAL